MSVEEIGRKRAEALGLREFRTMNSQPETLWGYNSHDVCRLLGEGVEVGGEFINGNWVGGITRAPHHKQHGLLIGIRPIKPPSREEEMEGLLRELIKIKTDNLPTGLRMEDAIERAKLLLERKDK